MKLTKASVISKIVIILLLLYASFTILRLRVKISDLQAEADALRQKQEELIIQNSELEYKLEHSNDDDVIADIAKDELGLIGANEKVYYDSDY